MLAIAKITAKGQTTVPQEVRAVLNVSAGDLIGWDVGADGTATVRRVQPLDIEYLRAVEGTLTEWAGATDEEAYVEVVRAGLARLHAVKPRTRGILTPRSKPSTSRGLRHHPDGG